MRRIDPFIWLSLWLVACGPAVLPAATASPAAVFTEAAPVAAPPTPSATPLPATAPATVVPAETPTNTPAPAPTALAPTALAVPVAPADLHQVVGGLQRPVFLTQPADGTNRLFIVEQGGVIVILRDGTLLPDPFLDLRDRVNAGGNEQGLLGLAFHPQYRQNGRFFVYYTDVDGNIVVARYTVMAGNPDRADPASAVTLLHFNHPFANHNGGDLVFGPDGYLYIGVGDGGSQGDPRGNGQNLGVLLGKLLRIDVNAEPYAIPSDNPFRGRSDARPEIWAYGLRNPWRFSFDRTTGDLYIADVGQDLYEEIDYQPAGDRGGENYGWNAMEGLHSYKGVAPPGLTPPILEYSHAEGGCSIVGGYVYHGTLAPQLTGRYLFGDYCSGLIWTLDHTSAGWQKTVLLSSSLSISSFAEDQAGEVYVLNLAGGAVYQWQAVPAGQG